MTVHGVDQTARLVTYKHAALGDAVIECEQRGADSGEFVPGTSSVLWPVSLLFCDHLCAHPEIVAGKTCVELGAGIGMVGAVAAALGAKRTVITDGDWGMAVLSATVERANKRGTPCEAMALTWGDQASIDRVGADGRFEVILACDVIIAGWAECHDALATTIKALLKPDGLVLVGFEFRDDWSTFSAFQDTCKGLGIMCESSSLLDDKPYPNLPEDFYLLCFRFMDEAEIAAAAVAMKEAQDYEWVL